MTFHDLTGDDFKVVILGPDGGETVRMGVEGNPDVVTLKVTGEQSAGTLTFIEYEAAPGSPGVKPHYHDGHEELFYVLEGTLRMRHGEEIVDAGPGTCVFVPRDVVHAFWNASDEPVRFVGTWTPAGFEDLFTARRELTEKVGDLTAEQNAELATEHGVHFVEMLPGERD